MGRAGAGGAGCGRLGGGCGARHGVGEAGVEGDGRGKARRGAAGIGVGEDELAAMQPGHRADEGEAEAVAGGVAGGLGAEEALAGAGAVGGGEARASSATVMRSVLPAAAAERRMRPPAGENFTALSSRFATAWRRRSRSPVRGRAGGRVASSVTARDSAMAS